MPNTTIGQDIIEKAMSHALFTGGDRQEVLIAYLHGAAVATTLVQGDPEATEAIQEVRSRVWGPDAFGFAQLLLLEYRATNGEAPHSF